MYPPTLETTQQKTVAITGARGFVGKKLSHMLAESGYQVLAFSRHQAPNKPSHPGISHIKTDYSIKALKQQLTGVNILIHLIAKTHAEDKLEELPQYRTINVKLTQTIAQCAATMGIQRFIYLSSIKVNGEATTKTPFNSQMPPAPTTAYGISKWEAEQTLIQTQRQTGLHTVIIRCPLIYSANAKGNIQALRKAISKGIPLPIGSIHNKRSIIDLECLGGLIKEVCESPLWDNQTLLVSSGKALSTPELAKKLGQDIGISTSILPFPVILLKLLFACIGKSQAINKLCDNLEITPDLSPQKS
jgi:nucleoside-diphosphate-sugar epimerase